MKTEIKANKSFTSCLNGFFVFSRRDSPTLVLNKHLVEHIDENTYTSYNI